MDEEALVLAPARLKAERLAKGGMRRLEGLEDEFDVVLSRRSGLRATNRELADLKAQMGLLQSEWGYKQRRDAQALQKLLAQQRDAHAQEKAQMVDRERLLTSRDLEREKATLARLGSREHEYSLTLIHLENLYEKKLALEAQRYDKLVKRMADQEMRASTDALRERQQAERRLAELKQAHEKEVVELRAQLVAFEARFETHKEEALAMVEAQASDFDEEIVGKVAQARAREQLLQNEVAEATEKAARMQIQLQQSRLKIERAGLTAREAEAAKTAAEVALKEVHRKNVSLVQATKDAEEKAQLSAGKVTDALAVTSTLATQKADLRAQVAHLLAQHKANNPAATLAHFERIVAGLDEEFLDAHAKNQAMHKQSVHLKATIHSLGSEVSALKKAASAREELFARLKEDIASFKDMRSLREKYFAAFLAAPSEGRGFGAGSGGRVSATEAAQHAAVEMEYTRQTKKNQATIAHLEHRVRDSVRQMRSSTHAHVDDNVTLMQQVNELRFVNRDFKAEIVRLTGEVAHQKLVMLSHGIGGDALLGNAHPSSSGGGGSGGVPGSAGQLSSLAAARRVQVAAEVASASAPIDVNAAAKEIGSLNDLLLVERYSSAAAQSGAAAAEQVRRDAEAMHAGAAAHFQALSQAHEAMLLNAYRRITEQEEEIKQLKGEQPQQQQQQTPRPTHAAPPPHAQSARRPASAAQQEAGSYVDSVIQRASMLRTQMQQGQAAGAADDDDDGSFRVSRPASATSYVPSGSQSARAPLQSRPHTAATMRSSAVEAFERGSFAQQSRPSSALSVAQTTQPQHAAKGSRAARNNNLSASIASTRAGSVESSATSTPAAHTPLNSARQPPSSFVPHSARARFSTATTTPHASRPLSAAPPQQQQPLLQQRSMVSAWMEGVQQQ
jgi:hypothetical protein